MNIETLKDKKTIVEIIYTEKTSIYKYNARIRYIDKDECLISSEFDENFHKPKNKTKAELFIKTVEGAYKSNVVINETSVLQNEIVFFIDTPVSWEIRESRRNIRAKVDIPVCIKFEDFEFTSGAVDLSMGGIRITETEFIPDWYINKTATVTMFLPYHEELSVEACYTRHDSNDEFHDYKTLNTFEFKSLGAIDKIKINNYLMQVLSSQK